jgi:formylmethanofuran dehydrogenase subunit A
MRLRLKGGRVLDPANGENGVASGTVRDIEIEDGRIVAATDLKADAEYDLGGDVVTAAR